MRKFFFIIGLFVILLSSCRSSRQVVQQNTTDSTSVSFRDVEKIIHVPGDSVSVSMQVVKAPFDTLRYSGSDAPIFVPQTQTIETKRTKVRIELTKTGEIKATAISKELDEKVTVQEKTISNYKSKVTEYQQKESFLAKAKATVWRWIKGILFSLSILAAIYAAIKLGFNPISIIKKLFNKS